MGNTWNDQWWTLVKAERFKGEQRLRAGAKRAKKVAAPKRKEGKQ